jgi:hypothetical protein
MPLRFAMMLPPRLLRATLSLMATRRGLATLARSAHAWVTIQYCWRGQAYGSAKHMRLAGRPQRYLGRSNGLGVVPPVVNKRISGYVRSNPRRSKKRPSADACAHVETLLLIALALEEVTSLLNLQKRRSVQIRCTAKAFDSRGQGAYNRWPTRSWLRR